MNTHRLWIVLLVVVMVAVAAGAGAVLRGDIADLKEADAAVREQKAILEEVGVEKQRFREKLEEMSKSVKASPDSLGSRGRAILDMSFIAGKEQTVLDQKEWRAEKRLAFQKDRRNAAKQRVVKWSGGLVLLELVLLAAVVVMARLSGRTRTA